MTVHELPRAGATTTMRPSAAPATEALSLEEASQAYGVSLSTLRRRLRAGELAGAFKVPGPNGDEWRIPAGALEMLGYHHRHEERQAAPAPAAAPAPELGELLRALERLTATIDSDRRQLQAAEQDRQDLRVEVARLEVQLDAEREQRRTLEARLAEPERPKRRRWWRWS